MPKLIDLTNKRFDRLLVIKRDKNDKEGRPMWSCKCDCGNKKIIRGKDLKNKKTKSCGCLQKEKFKLLITRHGKAHTRTYHIWSGMIQRCNNPSNHAYKYYGERGIKVCKRWMKFENFLEDMGEIPKGLTLDRIDNNKGYYKENCRLITQKEQVKNRNNNKLYYYNGKNQSAQDLANQYNINYRTLLSRINTLGQSIEKALTTPVKCRKK